MRRSLLLFMSAASLLVPTVAAASTTDAITGDSVVCKGIASDGHEIYSVSMTFTHAGRREARIYELSGSSAVDSDHAWFRGRGTSTFTGTLAGSPAGASVTFTLEVLKLDGSTNTLVATASHTIGPYAC
jgi:hypothetical protein